jgi:hypothetical protein
MNSGTHVLGELYALGHGGIHLPVARNNVLSHFSLSGLNNKKCDLIQCHKGTTFSWKHQATAF